MVRARGTPLSLVDATGRHTCLLAWETARVPMLSLQDGAYEDDKNTPPGTVVLAVLGFQPTNPSHHGEKRQYYSVYCVLPVREATVVQIAFQGFGYQVLAPTKAPEG